MQQADIPSLIESDSDMMAVLRAVRSLDLPDWWVGAGFVRNKIWDTLQGEGHTPPGDIDVVYFDPAHLSEEEELKLKERLEEIHPTGKWSVTNQARMSFVNGDAPYTSSLDAISHWPETATAIAVTLDKADHIIFKALHGVDDLLAFIIRPTPAFENKMEKYRQRLQKKDWQTKWSKVKIA